MTEHIATVFGGTGFVGRYIVRELAKAGYRVKVASRVPERGYFLRPYGHVGQIVPFACNYRDPVSITAVVRGSDVVINCVGILYEKRRGDFQRAHANLPGLVAQACASAGVKRLVHISALGVDKGRSRYAKTKLEGEKNLVSAFPSATILRPSVIFGPEDRFFNLFATMAQFLPFLPLIGGGRTKLQPVYVEDVAGAAVAAALLPVVGEAAMSGHVFELGGPEIVTLEDTYRMIFRFTGRSRGFVALPFGVARMMAGILQFLPPRPLLTPDQVISLQTDSVVAPDMPGLEDLGIRPTGLEQIVPVYLERFRPGGRFSDVKPA